MIPRVTLDDLFPRAQHEDEPFQCVTKLLKEPLACYSCGTPSVWVDLDAEAPVCSMVCYDAFYAGYEYARAYVPGVGLKMDPFEPDDEQKLVNLVKALYRSGKDLGWENTDITRLVGDCLIATADDEEEHPLDKLTHLSQEYGLDAYED